MFKLILASITMALTFSGCMGCTTVDSGHRGIRLVFGKADQVTLDEGLHFYNPFSTDIVEMSVREEKYDIKTDAYTKDTQKVNVNSAITIYPDKDKMHIFYQTLGKDWQDKIVSQAVLGSIKDVIGRIVADDLVGNRGRASSDIEAELKEKMSKRDVTLTKFEITELKFDSAYEQAVEAKVVATQRSAEAKNKTAQVKEEAAQKILAANAEAESMKIRSQALSQNKGLVEYEYAQAFKEKWDGTLPSIILGGGSMPIFDINSVMKKKISKE